jgi:uncharacterized protein (DUF305 family)
MQQFFNTSSLKWRSVVFAAAALAVLSLLSNSASAQQDDRTSSPIVVQPGAPGQPSKILPAGTKANLPPVSRKDVEFMQGMIMHHAQAVEMTDMIEARTKNKDIRLIGERISKSQTDEMKFMEQWLALRGEPVAAPTSGKSHSHSHGGHSADHSMLMPGMLSAKQMEALKNAEGVEFDRLFLSGMIQHHEGALVMVKDLFDTSGAGQDADLFSFATDVDSGQRAEIKSMQNLLTKKPV